MLVSTNLLLPIDDNDSDDNMSYLGSQRTIRKSKKTTKQKPLTEQELFNILDETPSNISNIREDDDNYSSCYETEDELSDVEERQLDSYEFITDAASNIKLYNGVLLNTKDAISKNIQLYSALCSGADLMFEPFSSSTLTANGLLNNIDFQHESIISKMTLPLDQTIIKIGCNEEEIYVFPNNYVDYNIAHLVDIVKNSKNTKFKTRIECHCQNLLTHADFILPLYKRIRDKIVIVKNADIVKHIEKYLATQKNRNKPVIERILRIFKRLMVYVFHPSVYDIENLVSIRQLLDQLRHSTEYERTTYITQLQDLFNDVEILVKFFKDYIGKCKCIQQPYDYTKRIPIKPTSDDIKLLSAAKITTKTQKYTKRSALGCGKYFSSQITFEIYGKESHKVYKIKIFRNGNFQAPGIKNKEMLDIIGPLTSLTNYLRDQFGTDIQVAYIISVMRNYLANVISTPFQSTLKDYNGRFKVLGTHLYLDALEAKCRQEKQAEFISPHDATTIFNILTDNFELKHAVTIWDYCGANSVAIAGITNNSEKSGGLLLKFDRPIPEKPNKKMTVKITSSGKINFDGCNSEIEVQELYYWLHNIFRRYKSEIMFNAATFNWNISDDDGYESLYD
jgi:hypothetical protein